MASLITKVQFTDKQSIDKQSTDKQKKSVRFLKPALVNRNSRSEMKSKTVTFQIDNNRVMDMRNFSTRQKEIDAYIASKLSKKRLITNMRSAGIMDEKKETELQLMKTKTELELLMAREKEIFIKKMPKMNKNKCYYFHETQCTNKKMLQTNFCDRHQFGNSTNFNNDISKMTNDRYIQLMLLTKFKCSDKAYKLTKEKAVLEKKVNMLSERYAKALIQESRNLLKNQ